METADSRAGLRILLTLCVHTKPQTGPLRHLWNFAFTRSIGQWRTYIQQHIQTEAHSRPGVQASVKVLRCVWTGAPSQVLLSLNPESMPVTLTTYLSGKAWGQTWSTVFGPLQAPAKGLTTPCSQTGTTQKSKTLPS